MKSHNDTKAILTQARQRNKSVSLGPDPEFECV